jgi:hypothetical protein
MEEIFAFENKKTLFCEVFSLSVCRLAAYQRTNRSTLSGKKEETFTQCVFYGISF